MLALGVAGKHYPAERGPVRVQNGAHRDIVELITLL